MKRLTVVASVLFSLLAGVAHAQETIKAFGPGGPAPAMKETAAAFGAKENVKVEVIAGPTGEWLDKAKAEGDLIFSGSEVMMTDFVTAMDGQIVEATITPLYLQPSAILVRPGKPKRIKGFSDLLPRDFKVLVVNGAGPQGLWEDMVGRSGDIGKVNALSDRGLWRLLPIARPPARSGLSVRRSMLGSSGTSGRSRTRPSSRSSPSTAPIVILGSGSQREGRGRVPPGHSLLSCSRRKAPLSSASGVG